MPDHQNDFYNCFSDLQRSALSYYQNPQGKNHLVFLAHAKKILANIRNEKAKKFLQRISLIEKKIIFPVKDFNQRKNIADEILTLGCLMK